MRVFNQVARERGLGALIDTQDPEPSRTLESREIDRNAYCRPPVKPGWIDCRFVLPRPLLEGLSLLARSVADRENGGDMLPP
jgi:hypothetical protein